MKLYELDGSDLETAYYDPAEDKVNARLPTDTRKAKLTLRALNRLKKMRALRRLEGLKRQDLFGVMYAEPDQGGGGGMPGGF